MIRILFHANGEIESALKSDSLHKRLEMIQNGLVETKRALHS